MQARCWEEDDEEVILKVFEISLVGNQSCEQTFENQHLGLVLQKLR